MDPVRAGRAPPRRRTHRPTSDADDDDDEWTRRTASPSTSSAALCHVTHDATWRRVKRAKVKIPRGKRKRKINCSKPKSTSVQRGESAVSSCGDPRHARGTSWRPGLCATSALVSPATSALVSPATGWVRGGARGKLRVGPGRGKREAHAQITLGPRASRSARQPDHRYTSQGRRGGSHMVSLCCLGGVWQEVRRVHHRFGCGSSVETERCPFTKGKNRCFFSPCFLAPSLLSLSILFVSHSHTQYSPSSLFPPPLRFVFSSPSSFRFLRPPGPSCAALAAPHANAAASPCRGGDRRHLHLIPNSPTSPQSVFRVFRPRLGHQSRPPELNQAYCGGLRGAMKSPPTMDPEALPPPLGTPPDDEVRCPELLDVSKARSCPGGSLSSLAEEKRGGRKGVPWRMTLSLAYQSLGVVYGDLSTSPLYVYKAAFAEDIQHTESNEEILGVLSFVFWTLTLVPLLKYVCIVLRADDHGEGGTFALYSLLCRHARAALLPPGRASSAGDDDHLFDAAGGGAKKAGAENGNAMTLGGRGGGAAASVRRLLEKHKVLQRVLLVLALVGTCMVIGDGVLTPAISGKFREGAWVPIVLAFIFMLIMCIWHYGTIKKYEFDVQSKVSINWLLGLSPNLGIVRVRGIGLIHTELETGIPAIFSHFRFLVGRIGPKEYRIYRCIVRYGYHDFHKDDMEFEKELVCSIAEFIRSGSSKLNGMSDDFDKDEEQRMSVVRSGSIRMLEEEGSVENTVGSSHGREIQSPSPSPASAPAPAPAPAAGVKKRVRFVLPAASPKPNAGVQEELQELSDAREAGMAFILGHSHVKAKSGSSFLRRFVINFCYDFLRRNSRGPNYAVTIPHASTLEVGMISAGLARRLRSLCITGDLSNAVRLLCQSPVCPGARTYALLLQECVNRRDARLGKRIHARMIATGFRCGEYITTKLLIFYVKIGDLVCARKLFDGMPHRSVVAWNAMISGCARGGAAETQELAVELFDAMRASGTAPDQFTFASVLCACARLAALWHGRRVHAVAAKSDVVAGGNVFVNSALVDMYLKSSCADDARRAFAAAPERNVTMWTAAISGHGQQGRAAEALELFDRMADDGFRPNDVTFLAVLSACAHAGLVDEGLRRFSSMSSEHGVAPRAPHYAAVVDMLARVGRLRDAYELVKNLPDCQEHSVVWGALLGACRKHGGDVALVELAARRFFRLQPENAGKYVVLANTYAAREMWDSVASAHEAMRALGVKKERAWSAIEVQGKKHTFLAGDTYHDKYSAIYEVCTALGSAVTERSV
ncbi:hypothetical protein HU200_058918 [Digitaria exilis]|uniref:Potassium transporter n=1 Tax=Digitaria exilis TaxID=1010633 RepID=A0A835E1A9_9POAL|nr:hypothetical protein HU200_058918 [Digitaria exilis]